MVQKRSSALI